MTAADQPTTEPSGWREAIIQTLDWQGAFCGTCGRQPGDPLNDCQDCSDVLQKYATAVIQALAARPLTAEGSTAEAVLRQHAYRVKYESPRVVTVFGCWGCDWEGDSSSIPSHQATMLAAAGLLAPAPQPAPDTEPDERLRGIQERAAAATAGPWATAQGKHPRLFGINGPDDYVTLHDGTLQEADAAFIAAARTDVPWLLAEVTRLDAVVAKQAAMHDGFLRSLATANGRSDDAERTAWGLPTSTQDRPEETRP